MSLPILDPQTGRPSLEERRQRTARAAARSGDVFVADRSGPYDFVGFALQPLLGVPAYLVSRKARSAARGTVIAPAEPSRRVRCRARRCSTSLNRPSSSSPTHASAQIAGAPAPFAATGA